MEKNWINSVYNIIKAYSDYDEQKKIWLGLSKDKIGSYDEYFNILYDDYNFDDFILEWKKENLDKTILKELIIFKDILNSFDKIFCSGSGWHDDDEVLKNPQWMSVVNQAKTIMKIWHL